MGRKLPPEQLTLYKRCDEVLQYLWDPIGVRGIPAARDEYETYLPMVFKLLINGESREKITDYLVSIETERMGMQPKRELAQQAAAVLVDWREWIADEAPQPGNAAVGLCPTADRPNRYAEHSHTNDGGRR